MKKIFALVPSEREKDCTHPLGFPYTGHIPCTGPRRCPLCGEGDPMPEWGVWRKDPHADGEGGEQ